ncbi:hypothetical protein NHG25_08505 [Aerococcaceae bacterium NML191292]|nr:hypothetical protein [Aerococcaceae bacterium NML191292]
MKILTLTQIEKQYEHTFIRRINTIIYVSNMVGSYLLSKELSKVVDTSYSRLSKETSDGLVFFSYFISFGLTVTLLFLLINTLITIAENGRVTNHLLLEAQRKEADNKPTPSSSPKPAEPLSKDDPWYYK